MTHLLEQRKTLAEMSLVYRSRFQRVATAHRIWKEPHSKNQPDAESAMPG
jgi:hypothetical protein